MERRAGEGPVYLCPMHSEVRLSNPGKCPHCGMDLVPEGARFAMLRHMVGSPSHVALMVALMAAIMVAAMIMMG